MKNIVFIRHGQSEGNVDKSVYFKKIDSEVELTNIGFDQSKVAGKELLSLFKHGGMGVSEVWVSPYIRAIQTAETALNEIRDYHPITYKTSPLIREREWGALRDIVEMGKKTEDHFNFFYRPNGGESFADVYQRVATFHNSASLSNADTLILFSHGELIKVYLHFLLEWTLDDFNKYKTPRNCQMFIVNGNRLSKNTPLTLK